LNMPAPNPALLGSPEMAALVEKAVFASLVEKSMGMRNIVFCPEIGSVMDCEKYAPFLPLTYLWMDGQDKLAVTCNASAFNGPLETALKLHSHTVCDDEFWRFRNALFDKFSPIFLNSLGRTVRFLMDKQVNPLEVFNRLRIAPLEK
jgi:hypothetical protein